MVERFDTTRAVIPSDNGDFVLYSDYADLQRQLAEVKAELTAAMKAADEYAPRALSAEAERDRLAAENEALREALTPSGATKAAYWGEFYMGVTLHARGQEDCRRIQIPWTSIKEIMAAITARAALDTAKGAEK